MNAAENNLVQLLTGKPSLQDVTVDELKAIATQYPYFSLGQLLLAKKLKQDQPESFYGQLQHCALYFQDISWLQNKLFSKKAPIATHNKAITDQPAVERNAVENRALVGENDT